MILTQRIKRILAGAGMLVIVAGISFEVGRMSVPIQGCSEDTRWVGHYTKDNLAYVQEMKEPSGKTLVIRFFTQGGSRYGVYQSVEEFERTEREANVIWYNNILNNENISQ